MDSLYVENLSVSFDGLKALDISSFEVDKNELRVVIGPNGAGKTTLLDVLCGKTKPDEGRAIFADANLANLSEDEIVDIGVGRKFQAPSVFDSLTVFDNLMLAIKVNRGVFASLFHRVSAAERSRIGEVAEQAGLQDVLGEIAGSSTNNS